MQNPDEQPLVAPKHDDVAQQPTPEQPSYDVLADAGSVASQAMGLTIEWAKGFRVRQALRLRDLMPDGLRTGWVAKIVGRDTVYGLDRRFLARAYPLRPQENPPRVYDCSHLAQDDVLQIHIEGVYAHKEVFVRITSIGASGMYLHELDDDELADLYYD